jgi:NAD(P)-dependent dehydrogenase (short-subunit alcohol dehydrogenase family)
MATYLITGANRGIGYEYCRQLQERGDKVIAVYGWVPILDRPEGRPQPYS